MGMDLIKSCLEQVTKFEEIAPVLKVSRIATLPEQPGQNAVVHDPRTLDGNYFLD